MDQRLWAQQDANFNVTSVSNDAGAVVERYVYTPYGKRTVLNDDFTLDSDNTSDFDFDLGHQGLRYDAETGLVYNRARYLHTDLGRFISRDPLGYVDGMSVYQYVYSTPYFWVDPSGLGADHSPFVPMPMDEDTTSPTPSHYSPMPAPREILVPAKKMPDAEDFNCHSACWAGGHPKSTDPGFNPNDKRWIDDPSGFMAGAIKLGPEDRVRIGDIVVYYPDVDGNGALTPTILAELNGCHSATVVSVDSNGDIIQVVSKEGPSDITTHGPTNQNPGYGPPQGVYRPKLVK